MTQEPQGSQAVVRRDAALTIRDTEGTRSALISRFGQDEFGASLTIVQFIAIAAGYGLNPWMGHIVPFQGRIYIERDGWTHLINREAPGQLAAIDERQATPDEYEQFRVPQEDYFAVATVIRRWPVTGLKPRDWPTTAFTRRARVTKRQTQPSEREVAARGRGAKIRHIVEDPWDMAFKQATVRALRMGFNDCAQKAKPEGLPSVEPQNEGDAIEAQAVVVAGGADWSRLWTVASEQALDKAGVHTFFGVGPEDGDLQAYAARRSHLLGVPRQQVAEDMADELEAEGRKEGGGQPPEQPPQEPLEGTET